MLRTVSPGVRVATAARWATTTTIVEADGAALVVDPALTRRELAALADDLAGLRVVAGFSTHPHWDHLLWHPGLGDAPRWATPGAVGHARANRAALLAEARATTPVDEALVGQLTALPGAGRAGRVTLPWPGPDAVVVPYRAHSPGSAALVVAGAMVAGDVLSDREVPLLDGDDPDPIGSYLGALDELEAAARDLGVGTLVPGHGTVTDAAGLAARLAADRAYLSALRDGTDVVDHRLAEPDVARAHAAQVARWGAAAGQPSTDPEASPS